MTIDDFLRESGVSAASVTRRLKVSHTAVNNWRSGRSQPRPEMMDEIKRVTRSKVRERDFLPKKGH